jgi:hypothetical protein
MCQYQNHGVSIVNRVGTYIQNIGLDAGNLPQIKLAQLLAVGGNGYTCFHQTWSFWTRLETYEALSEPS